MQGLKKKLRKYATQCRPFYLPDLYTASVISPQARLHKFIHLGHTLRRSAFDSQVRAKHKDELSNIVKAQATTTKLRQSAPPSQWSSSTAGTWCEHPRPRFLPSARCPLCLPSLLSSNQSVYPCFWPFLRCVQTVEEAYKFLREQNLGVMPDGRTYGEVMDHFVTGGR